MDISLHAPTFNGFDIFVCVVVVFSILLGAMRGFMREGLGLAAWGAAGYVATQDFDLPRGLVHKWIQDPLLTRVAAMVLVFSVSLVVFLILVQILVHWVHATMAQSVDRALGMVFGMLRGVIFLVIGYGVAVFSLKPSDHPPLVRLSRICPLLQQALLFSRPLWPKMLANHPTFQAHIQDITPAPSDPQDMTRQLSHPQPSGYDDDWL